MNVLSLFDGCSCGQVALSKADIKVDKYYASEIDKYAIKVTQANWPDTIQLGDIEKWKEWDIDWSSIDLLIGGSPCQGFSFAGKQLAFDDPRSRLFFVYVDILNHIKSLNPDVKFMLENVQMKEIALNTISYYLGVEPVFINSALVCAQTRKRYYWRNWHVDQPADRGVVLADILETDGEHVTRSYGEYVSKGDKSLNIDANYHKGADNHGQRSLILQYPRGKNAGGLKALDGKVPTLSASSWEHNNHLTNGISYRKLTPIECERLQGLPDNYTIHVSSTQRYKMLGNGWQVDTIEHILKQMQNPLKGQLKMELETGPIC